MFGSVVQLAEQVLPKVCLPNVASHIRLSYFASHVFASQVLASHAAFASQVLPPECLPCIFASRILPSKFCLLSVASRIVGPGGRTKSGVWGLALEYLCIDFWGYITKWFVYDGLEHPC